MQAGSLRMSEATNPQFDPENNSLEAIAARLTEERQRRRLTHQPANNLHVRPNLDHYRKLARRLQKTQLEEDPSARLHAAQLAVARDVGFASWRGLVAAIRKRDRASRALRDALRCRDQERILRVVREHPLALLDAGSVASPDELELLLRIVPMSRHDPDMLTDLLDAVAEHHTPEGLAECVGMLLNRGADPFYANDTIEDRRERFEASPNGEQDAELLDSALGIMAWYVDEPDDGGYIPEGD